jgi:catechol 2,3-dioxygenase-like lactoylglutathione lyase family enzyme
VPGRPVKKTVNFDDPGTYHLYFGEEVVDDLLKQVYNGIA